MRGPRAAALQISPVQHDLLQRLRRQQTTDQWLVRRVSIILALAADPCVAAVAQQMGLTRLTVRTWRDRWIEATPDLHRAEQDQIPQQLSTLLEQVLYDAPGPGSRPPSAPIRSSRSWPSLVSRVNAILILSGLYARMLIMRAT